MKAANECGSTRKGDLNSKKKEKLPWLERSRIIHEDFPSIESLDWNKALSQDIGLVGLIIKDVLKHDQEPTGRPGPRPPLDPKKMGHKIMQIKGEDFSVEEFPETVDSLRKDMSLLTLSKKSKVNHNDIYRMYNKEKQPNLWVMSRIAGVFGKRPEYFLECRIIVINNYITRKLLDTPVSSITAFKQLKNI